MTESLLEEEAGESIKTARNGTPPYMGAKKVKRPKKKAKSQAKVRRRTVNPKKVKKGDRQVSGSAEDSSDGEEKVPSQQLICEESGDDSGGEGEGVSQDKSGEDEEWDRLQQTVQKHSKKKYEKVESESHLVHAPYFPEVE